MAAADLSARTDSMRAEYARTDSMRAEGDRKAGGAAAGLAERLTRLAGPHPSAAGYFGDGSRAAGPDGPGDGDQARRIAQAADAARRPDLEARIADARAMGRSSSVSHTVDGAGEVWLLERETLHNEIIGALYGQAATVPCEYRAALPAGLPGAGKTTVLREHAALDPSRYLTINPDVIKHELAKRGMVPGVDGLSPMEATQLVHEETSHLAKRLAQRAQAEGRNLIWDITMSTGASAEGRVAQLRTAGYTRVEAVFVDVPVDVSIRRAAERHRDGQREYLAGSGLGGRYLSPDLITSSSDPDWGSRNRMHFERLKDRVDAWSVYDNSADGRAPVLVRSYRPASGHREEEREH